MPAQPSKHCPQPQAPTGLYQPDFLPMSRRKMKEIGWEELDVLLISGDAYVDHPAFACALLGRWLVAHGFRTGILAQPRWQDESDLLRMGRPRLFAGISAGAIDSMLAHYTAFRKKRRDDPNSPGSRAGLRPNRASLVYANLARRAFPNLPLVLGGIEASLRRASHYDFWSDKIRRPLLMDAKADLLLYGMGEQALLECASRLQRGEALAGIAGSCWLTGLDSQGRPATLPGGYEKLPGVELPSHEQILADPWQLMLLTRALERQVHDGEAWAFSRVGQRALVIAPPAAPPSEELMDQFYALPFSRRQHPAYTEPVPAAAMLASSISSHRGCGGGCSFCSLALHQGRRVSSRSEKSILAEAASLASRSRSRGVSISDIGGPTANMWGAKCRMPPGRRCTRPSCCFPRPCQFFLSPQQEHVRLLRQVAALPGVRQVRVASGLRPDLALREPKAAQAYVREFTGGQLKLAPEHSERRVLELMRKPALESFEKMLDIFGRESNKAGREQYVVPYLMSAFPGCSDEDMAALARWLARRGWRPQQCQCFIPTPGTIATAMYWSGRDERGRPIDVARSDAERLRQHKLLMGRWGRPES